MENLLRIGLTGGIGSGKSTACRIFSDLGVPVIDADQIAHELSAKGQPAHLDIILAFGDKVIRSDGELDRSKIREIIFNDDDARLKLEGILHPLIYNEIDKQVSKLDHDYCIICIPLLIESGATNKVDRILVIDTPVEQQIKRTVARDGMDQNMITRIINTQVTRNERLSIADDIISNDGDIESLKKQIIGLNDRYKNLSGK
jgi:dephospho-CoA kinase